MRRFGCVLAICLAALTARAEDLTARAEAMLSAGVDTVVPIAHFAALGPDVVPALIAIFERADGPRHVRLRALGTLAALDDARTTRWLETLVQEAALDPASLRFENTALVLRRALDGLAAREQSELVLTKIAPLLDHRDGDVRRVVAQLLGRKPPTAATRARITARTLREDRLDVQQALGAALTGRSDLRSGLRLVRPESAPPPR